MPANITAAETCCGSQCRTAQMKEMKTPKGALRCFFFFFKSTWLLLLLFFSPSSSTPVLFALWAYFTSRLARKKKNGNSRTRRAPSHLFRNTGDDDRQSFSSYISMSRLNAIRRQRTPPISLAHLPCLLCPEAAESGPAESGPAATEPVVDCWPGPVLCLSLSFHVPVRVTSCLAFLFVHQLERIDRKFPVRTVSVLTKIGRVVIVNAAGPRT